MGTQEVTYAVENEDRPKLIERQPMDDSNMFLAFWEYITPALYWVLGTAVIGTHPATAAVGRWIRSKMPGSG